MTEDSAFDSHADPEHPGWVTWNLRDPSRFNGQALGHLRVRREPDGGARLRMTPGRQHTNLSDNLHGGAILALADVALFATAKVHGLEQAGPAATVELSMQFLAAGRPDAPVDAVAQVLRETRRLMFLRGLIEQDGERIAAFSGLIRKPSAPKPSPGER